MKSFLVLVILVVAGMTETAATTPDSLPVDVRRSLHVVGDAAAGAKKITVCAACHGADGNAVAPLFPSLAAQPGDYTYLQLESFKNDWRTSPVMQPLVTTLSQEDMRDIAAYFAIQKRRPPVSAAASEEAGRGKAVYLEGDSGRGIPPCQGCHGADGAGISRGPRRGEPLHNDTTYPGIAGLSSDYVVAQLNAFRQGDRAGTTNARIMQGVARTVDPESAAALGAYLATLGIE